MVKAKLIKGGVEIGQVTVQWPCEEIIITLSNRTVVNHPVEQHSTVFTVESWDGPNQTAMFVSEYAGEQT